MPPLSQSRAGSALVEFALVTPFLLLLMAALLNYGLLLRTTVCVADAARAGAQYGSRSIANSTDSSGIEAAAVKSAPDVAHLTVTSTRSCSCPDGNPVSCTGSCVGGGVRIYVQVNASATGSAIFTYPALPFSGASSSQAVMRVQ
jgi:Flp pilus assembly protein TadG